MKPDSGLWIQFSPMNAAYFLMWHGSILSVINSKAEAVTQMRLLLDSGEVSGSQYDRKG